VYRVEFHCHSIGDPRDKLSYTPEQAVDAAVEAGVNVLAITWHIKIFNQPHVIDSAKAKGLLLVPGVEAEITGSHVLVLNITPGDLADPAHTSWEEIRALKARRSDVLVIAPHPFYLFPFCLAYKMDAGVDCIDAVEWCHAHISWLPLAITPNGRAIRWAKKHNKPMIACSDAHRLSNIGRYASDVDSGALEVNAIFAAIKANRIKFDEHGLPLLKLIRFTLAIIFVDVPKILSRLLGRRAQAKT
jgi:predicted metal-dependent phosphoesterase TrpH